jgi:hypothetical protein
VLRKREEWKYSAVEVGCTIESLLLSREITMSMTIGMWVYMTRGLCDFHSVGINTIAD